MSKILKFVWFVSLFGGLAALLWSYASLPYDVMVTETFMIGREAFFYIALAILCVANFTLYAISKNNYVGANEILRTWKYIFGIIVNAFFVASVVFINIFNDSQAFDYDNFGYLIISLLSLLILWIIALPAVIFFTRK